MNLFATVFLAIGLFAVSTNARNVPNVLLAIDNDDHSIKMTPKEAHKVYDCLDDKGFETDKWQDDKYLDKHMPDILECFGDISNLRPVVALINLGLSVEDKVKDGAIEFCGKTFNIERSDSTELIEDSDEEENEKAPNIGKQLSNTKTDFCSLTFNTVLPEFCQLKSACSKEELNTIFAIYYVTQQMMRKHPEPFSCMGKNEKELLGDIVNKELYTSKFDFKKSVLTKRLPCNQKLASSPSNTPHVKGNNIASLIHKTAFKFRL